MSTQKQKFALYSKLQALGFTYDEAWALRRIELTLQSWAVRECGDGTDWAIERDEKTERPYNVYHGEGKPRRYPIADREAGALGRLKAIVQARNLRVCPPIHVPKDPNGAVIQTGNKAEYITPYHQGDCRGCMLYLVRAADIPAGSKLESCYTNGLAVCC